MPLDALIFLNQISRTNALNILYDHALRYDSPSQLAEILDVQADVLEDYLNLWSFKGLALTFDVLKNLSTDELLEVCAPPRVYSVGDESLLSNAVRGERYSPDFLDLVLDDSLGSLPRVVREQVEIDIPSNTIVLEQVSEGLDGAPSLVDPSFLWSILDPRPLFLPMTLWRLLWWLFLLASIGGLSYAILTTKFIALLQKFAEFNCVPLAVVLYTYEPLINIMYMLFSNKYPDNDPQLLMAPSRNLNPKLAVIIACHNSAAFIGKTVEAAMRHVAPDQIFIMDNGKGDSPTDNTQEVVHSINNNIHYFYLEKTGNKTIALLIGAQYVTTHCPHLEFSLILDDDTLIPNKFTIRHEFFIDACVQGIVYPLRGKSPYKKAPLVSRYQDLEYKFSDLEMAFLDLTDGVARPHGAASLWRTGTLKKILEKHNGVFKGEDAMMGIILSHLSSPNGSNKLRIDQNCSFSTVVPQTYLGTYPNLYQQRIRSWNEAPFLYPWQLVLKPLLTARRGSLASFLSIKNSQFYNLYTQLVYISRYFFMILLRNNPTYWAIFSGLKGVDLILTILFNYGKLPLHMRSDFLTVCTYPIYKESLSMMGTISFLRVIFLSAPTQPHPRSLNFQFGHGRVNIPDSSRNPRPINSGSGGVSRYIRFDNMNEADRQQAFIPTQSFLITEGQSASLSLESIRTFFASASEIGSINVNPIHRLAPKTAIHSFLYEEDSLARSRRPSFFCQNTLEGARGSLANLDSDDSEQPVDFRDVKMNDISS